MVNSGDHIDGGTRVLACCPVGEDNSPWGVFNSVSGHVEVFQIA